MSKKLGDALKQRLQSAQDYDLLEVNIFLTDEPAREILGGAPPDAVDTRPGGPQDTAQVLRERAQASQRELVTFLETSATRESATDDGVTTPLARGIETYWINNAVRAEVTPAMLEELLKRDDVAYIEAVRHADDEELLDAEAALGGGASAAEIGPPQERRDVVAASETWSVRRVNAPLLWKLGIRGEGVRVAVLDTGVNYRHPDLADRMWRTPEFPNHGYDFASGDNDPMDAQGHGTACAGIVAGDGRLGKATGVAPRATVMAVRVGGDENRFWRGMEFAIEQGARVISMSMSWKYPNNPDYPGWRRACESVLAAGILHANSIGNQGDRLTRFPIPYNIATPGNCPPPRLHPLQPIQGGISSAIACGATDDLDGLAGYSGRGPAEWDAASYRDYPYELGVSPGLVKPEICAPGPGTESCDYRYGSSGGRPYRSFGGTSAATPHVAGCLALLACAGLRSGGVVTPARALEAIEATAVRIAGQSKAKQNHFGAGRIDAYGAYVYGRSRGWWGASAA